MWGLKTKVLEATACYKSAWAPWCGSISFCLSYILCGFTFWQRFGIKELHETVHARIPAQPEHAKFPIFQDRKPTIQGLVVMVVVVVVVVVVVGGGGGGGGGGSNCCC